MNQDHIDIVFTPDAVGATHDVGGERAPIDHQVAVYNFDDPSGPEPGRFVAIENSKGELIKFGQWLQRDDGFWVLRISRKAHATSD